LYQVTLRLPNQPQCVSTRFVRASLRLYYVLTLIGIAIVSSKCLAQEQNIEGWSQRIEKALQEGKPDEAMREMDAAIGKYPDNPQLYILRGSLKFRSGKIEDSIVDFDKSIELSPSNKPYLWQRGISLYYAGKYEEGLEQFDVHRNVNPNDVENAFWHFLCNVKLKGLEAAQKDVLLAGYDSRTPLMQVQQLIQGKTTPEEVIAASEKGGAGSRGQKLSRFYGYLYIGLYYDALGNHAKAREWVQKCIDLEVFSYMGDVAKIHLEHLDQADKAK
jgi:lipoprotein NlpI